MTQSERFTGFSGRGNGYSETNTGLFFMRESIDIDLEFVVR